MGYSATAKACMVLDTFDGQEESSNVWSYKGHQYMYEVGREQADGAITGTVWRMDGHKAGSYRINPDGHVARAPAGMRGCLNEVLGLAHYLKAYEPREAWRKACEYDAIDPGALFVAFSPDNPYAS